MNPQVAQKRRFEGLIKLLILEHLMLALQLPHTGVVFKLVKKFTLRFLHCFFDPPANFNINFGSGAEEVNLALTMFNVKC